jgi:hypothetical protein
MRDKILCLLLALSVVASSAQAQPKRPATAPAPKVVELGRIGASAPSEAEKARPQEKSATPRAAPSRQDMIAALNTRQKAGGNLALGPTFRVTPNALYNANVSALLWCTSSAGRVSSHANGGHWQCDSGQSNELRFNFRQLTPNSTYLATVDHAFLGAVDVVTTLNGQEQTTTIDGANPLYLVFQTGAGQTTATVKIQRIRGSAFQSGGSWYSLDLAKVQ